MIKKIQKISSGIAGFDEIAHGGVPGGRTTLVSGASGSGKTIFTAQFLYKGAVDLGENGVFVSFEEKPVDIITNMQSFGWDIEGLIREKKWVFVDASPDEADRMEDGKYDLGAFLARIEYAVKKVGARRVAIDSISALFVRYQDADIIRWELYRLISALKKSGITCVMTAEKPAEGDALSRYGVEEFVSDNVILLHNRLNTRGERERTIEILKFRGASHGSEATPLIVDKSGMSIFPRLRLELGGKGFFQKISTGVKGIDELLFGGVYRNSATLISGAPGTGKTVAALHFIMEGARKKEKSLLIEFAESPDELFRNAFSLGWDLKKYVDRGIVKLVCHYPEDLKIEQHARMIREMVIENKTKRVVLDSLSVLQRICSKEKFREFVMGLIAFLKMQNATSFLINTTNQVLGGTELTDIHLSLAADNIIVLKYVELAGQMRRLLSVLKQRGSMHTKDLMEFEVNPDKGMKILKPFEGAENLMGGHARVMKILEQAEN